LISQHENDVALPELGSSLLDVLTNIRPHVEPVWPRHIQELHVAVSEQLVGCISRIKKSRVPLEWRRATKTAIDSKAPKFQLDYTFKKDLDPDHERAKLKQMHRQLTREQKAAMRELRRDSEFLDQQRLKEATAAHEARKAERVKNFGWMESQKAILNSHIRTSKDVLKGGGTGHLRKKNRKF